MTAQEALAAAINGTLVSQDITVANAATILAALAGAGWAVVPREPTPGMIDAGRDANRYTTGSEPDIYAAMLAAGKSEPPPTYKARPTRR